MRSRMHSAAFGLLGLAFFFGPKLPVACAADALYRLNGRIVEVSPDQVAIRAGREIFKFSRNPAPASGKVKAPDQALTQAKAGDLITVWYSLDARWFELVKGSAKSPHDRAGQAPKGARKPPRGGKPDQEAPDLGPILDDREFYNASVNWKAVRLALVLQNSRSSNHSSPGRDMT